MRKLITLSLIISTVALTSFTLIESPESVDKTFSFYKSEGSSPLIQLKLNPDNTFTLKDHSRPGKAVDVEGKYTLKGSVVHLYDFESVYSIAKRWKMDEDYPCIRSRNVLNFTRICEE